MIRCPHCGAMNNRGVSFCVQCQTNVHWMPTAREPASNTSNTGNKEPFPWLPAISIAVVLYYLGRLLAVDVTLAIWGDSAYRFSERPPSMAAGLSHSLALAVLVAGALIGAALYRRKQPHLGRGWVRLLFVGIGAALFGMGYWWWRYSLAPSMGLPREYLNWEESTIASSTLTIWLVAIAAGTGAILVAIGFALGYSKQV